MVASEQVAHTPGAWEIDGIAVAAGNQTICLMGEPAHWSGGSPDMMPNAEANARLIAQAPAMLSLIEDIEESLTADDTHRLLREACRELIAKATRP